MQKTTIEYFQKRIAELERQLEAAQQRKYNADEYARRLVAEVHRLRSLVDELNTQIRKLMS